MYRDKKITQLYNGLKVTRYTEDVDYRKETNTLCTSNDNPQTQEQAMKSAEIELAPM